MTGPPYHWALIHTVLMLCIMKLFDGSVLGLLVGTFVIILSAFLVIPVVKHQNPPWYKWGNENGV